MNTINNVSINFRLITTDAVKLSTLSVENFVQNVVEGVSIFKNIKIVNLPTI